MQDVKVHAAACVRRWEITLRKPYKETPLGCDIVTSRIKKPYAAPSERAGEHPEHLFKPPSAETAAVKTPVICIQLS